MTDLIACLSTGKGTWPNVQKIIEDPQWNRVFLIVDKTFQGQYKPKGNAEQILIDPEKPLVELAEDLRGRLHGKISDMEVALNFFSGTGKEHMAVLSAVLRLGLGVRLIALTREGIKEI